jgi:hypothetical protein
LAEIRKIGEKKQNESKKGGGGYGREREESFFYNQLQIFPWAIKVESFPGRRRKGSIQEQGCQIVHIFSVQNLGKYWRSLEKIFRDHFGILYGHLVFFMAIW